jgi:hypothetical protein
MYIAMRGTERIVEGTNLDQVVIAAESYLKKGDGDIVVWLDNKYIAAEIEDQDIADPFTTYRMLDTKEKRK